MSAEIDRLRLAKLLGLLGSDHDSEVAAAGRAADRLRRAAGATWHDIVQPALPPPNRDYSIAEQIEIARGCPNELTDWERQFVASLALRRKPLTEKQRAVLAEIVREVPRGSEVRNMSAFDDALAYAARGWPVFPCSTRKVPFTEHGHADASTDPDRIRTWWAQLPYALIGMPTGERTGLAVLDIDMKRGKNGLRPLSGLLGTSELPVTPTGGLHLHFRRPEGGFGNTVGAAGRGIGEGLDWRCDGGYVVLPSKGTGYRWYNHTHDTCAPIDVPEVLLPRRVDPDPYGRHGAGVSGRRDSAAAANLLAGVARKLAEAPGAEGNRNWLLYWCACRFGEAIAQGVIAEDDARSILAGAARHLGLTDREISATIKSGFGRTGR